MLGLTLMAERFLEVKRKLFVCFVDYKKAFDRIQHEKLIHILQNIGLDSHDIMIVRNYINIHYNISIMGTSNAAREV